MTAPVPAPDRDRELSHAEVAAHGLPIGGCCCVEHGHRWYERTKDGRTWHECYHCADWREAAR